MPTRIQWIKDQFSRNILIVGTIVIVILAGLSFYVETRGAESSGYSWGAILPIIY